MSTNGRRPELGRLESAVLAVVAASPEPVTVAQVQTQLPADPAYTTVMSTLARLAKKGALRQIRDGRAYRYEPAAPAGSIDDALTARQMRRLLGDGGDRAAVLARFVAELDESDERLLADLLGRTREHGPATRRD
jgi:predicted transcriptional regulator